MILQNILNGRYRGAGTGVAGCGSATPALAEVWRGVARKCPFGDKKKEKGKREKEKREKERERERERERGGDWSISGSWCGEKIPPLGKDLSKKCPLGQVCVVKKCPLWQQCGEEVPLRASVWRRRAPKGKCVAKKCPLGQPCGEEVPLRASVWRRRAPKGKCVAKKCPLGQPCDEEVPLRASVC